MEAVSCSRTLFAAAFSLALAGSVPAGAQQAPTGGAPAPAAAVPAAAPAPAAASTPPSWMQGAPDSAGGSKLAPVQAPPIAAAADKLPVAALHLPKGFHLEVYASGITNARSIRRSEERRV